MTDFLTGCDDMVSQWAWRTFGFRPMPIDRAVGLVDAGQIIGAVIWQNFNGHNVDVSYYGPGTVTPGVARAVARFTLREFDPARVTVMTAKANKRIARFFTRIGAKFEGVMRDYYGRDGSGQSSAVRFVLTRDAVERIAQSKRHIS